MSDDQHCCCPCGTFRAGTMWALGLGLLYFVFMFSATITVRWWVMLPLALVSFLLFRVQRGQTEGLEKQVCDWGYWIILAGLILRDMCLSGQLASVYHKLAGADAAVRTVLHL